MSVKFRSVALAVCIFSFGLMSPSTVSVARTGEECGSASWYALTSRTASGEMMNPAAMTAAHKTLPFGTKVRVVNHANGRELEVRINDRGPFVKGRIIDLSRAAAEQLGFKRAGHTKVCIAQI